MAILLYCVQLFVFGKQTDTIPFSLRKVNISDVKVDMSVNKDSIDIEFNASFEKRPVGTNYRMILYPMLILKSDTIEVRGLMIYGKHKIKREEQERILAGKRYVADTTTIDYYVVNKDSVFKYSNRIAYVPSMSEGMDLVINQFFEGCCEREFVGQDTHHLKIPEKIIIKNYAPVYSKVEAKANWVFNEEDLTIFFNVSRIFINDTLFTNMGVLQSVSEAVNSINTSKKDTLDKIEITGFASPEGPLKFNTELGRNRAIALRDYMKAESRWLTDDNFTINNGVENWDGAKKMVEGSTMRYRDEVLELMNTVKPEAGLKNKLMKLRNGEPWAYMVKEYFPKLRLAKFISVSYESFGDETSEEINSAVDLMSEGQFEEALSILEKHLPDERISNLIGVCYMMTNRESEATIWFEKAIERGSKDAETNLQQINIHETQLLKNK